jgi:hypothetical protein
MDVVEPVDSHPRECLQACQALALTCGRREELQPRAFSVESGDLGGIGPDERACDRDGE